MLDDQHRGWKFAIFAIAFLIGFFVFQFVLFSFRAESCQTMYGAEWGTSGYYTPYCTNGKGDMKSLRKW